MSTESDVQVKLKLAIENMIAVQAAFQAYMREIQTKIDELDALVKTLQSQQPTPTPGPTPTPTPVPGPDLDLILAARADMLFSQQSGSTLQTVGQYNAISRIPEEGYMYHGDLRFGRKADDDGKPMLIFRLGPNDPNTSGNKRTELSFSPNIKQGQVYWNAFRLKVWDWGSQRSDGLFGTQLHSGDNSLGLSPAFGIYYNGRNMRFETRYSKNSRPNQSNDVTDKHAEQEIPFGEWMDWVIQFRLDWQGNGFARAWLNGKQIVDYSGALGFNTPGKDDYFKSGIYNWTSFSSVRQVALRNYIAARSNGESPEVIRQYINE